MASYNHKDIESKWQKKWTEAKLYETNIFSDKKKCYVLDMFPYPSGEGLHVGHPKGYIATDIYSRMKKMHGFEVLHPMGWDAFGLPAEQFALKNKVHPKVAVEKNIKRFKEQLAIIGFNYDWSKELNTTDPEFYKWTQWIFKQMFKKGLAQESHAPINWCPSCITGLSNEDLEGGLCERCGSVVEKKPIRQWVLKITEYADRMLTDLDSLNWPTHIKESQRNWIGKSEGVEFDFKLIDAPEDSVKIFTTRADTLFGATFVAISAELAKNWIASGWKVSNDALNLIEEILKDQKAIDYSADKEKKGIFTDIYAINPANEEKIPVWIANYVLGGVGTGAIMAVPAHDTRDGEFAEKYNIFSISVISPETGIKQDNPEFRKSIVAVVRDKKNSTFLSLNWGEKLGGNLFIGGGLDDGEDVISCALREIKEETGYNDLTFISQTVPIYHNYFAHSKNIARRIKVTGLLFELNNETKSETKLEENEKNKFTVEWLSSFDISIKIIDELHALVFKKLVQHEIYTGKGILINSGDYNNLESDIAMIKITEAFGGKVTKRYKLQDWVFARQRYWGEPFPIVFDENHFPYTVADSELPVKLPEVESYEPTGTGESPLSNIKDWVEVYGYLNDDNEFITSNKESGNAKLFYRETNTMPQWAGSSWYYLRYIDPHNADALIDKKKDAIWSPVDFYVGGAEHATRHLIYARFYHKFLYDIGIVNYEEPFKRLQNVGLIQAEDGRKMSKRFGNVVNPDDVIETFGADTLRIYEMFMGPFDQAVAWSTKSMAGSQRFLERLWKLSEKVKGGYIDSNQVLAELHKTIKKTVDDIELFKFNTAISQMMILLNLLEKEENVSTETYLAFMKILAPFAPHITEELWSTFGGTSSIHLETWPKYDESKLLTQEVTIVIQVGGKLRGTLVVSRDMDDEMLKVLIQQGEIYKKHIGDSVPKKIIIVKNKIVNIVL
jgi:leucyl-tRNA synthetase